MTKNVFESQKQYASTFHLVPQKPINQISVVQADIIQPIIEST